MRAVGDETAQAICLNNIGAAYLSKAQYADALTYFQQALQLRDEIWRGAKDVPLSRSSSSRWLSRPRWPRRA